MPDPIALCLEDISSPNPSDRFIRCVAVRGNAPGLGVTADGQVVWQPIAAVAFKLFVSLDDRLILLRELVAPTVTVWRAGRSVEAPPGRPVVLISEDEIALSGRRLRVWIHGVASQVHEPSPFQPARRGVSTIAAAVAISAAVACNRQPTPHVEVRDQPPAPTSGQLHDAGVEATSAIPEADAASTADASAATDAPVEAASDAKASDASTGAKKQPIEIRERPPYK